MSDEIVVDPADLANEQTRLRAVAEQMTATAAAITTAAGDVLTETAAWGAEWEALDAYDPTAADLNEGMVKIAASLGAIISELDTQAQVTVKRASDTEELEAEAEANFESIDTDLGTPGGGTFKI